MQNEARTWTSNKAKWMVSGVSTVTIVLGVLAIAAGKLGHPTGPGHRSLMPAPDAGVAFVLLGISLAILARRPTGRWKRIFARLSAFAVVMWAAITLIHLASDGLALKPWLLQWVNAASAITIIMSATSASNFILLGLALLIAPLGPAFSWALTKFLCLCSASLAFICAMDAILLPDISFSETGILSCLTFMACSTAIPVARLGSFPEVFISHGLGSQVLRQLLPAAFAIPIALAWLTLQGEIHGLFGGEFGVATAALVTVVLLGVLIWGNARTLNRHENMLKQAQEELKLEQTALEIRVQERTAALVIANRALEQEISERKKSRSGSTSLRAEIPITGGKLTVWHLSMHRGWPVALCQPCFCQDAWL
jgi:hypothetical protein